MCQINKKLVLSNPLSARIYTVFGLWTCLVSDGWALHRRAYHTQGPELNEGQISMYNILYYDTWRLRCWYLCFFPLQLKRVYSKETTRIWNRAYLFCMNLLSFCVLFNRSFLNWDACATCRACNDKRRCGQGQLKRWRRRNSNSSNNNTQNLQQCRYLRLQWACFEWQTA